MSGTAFAQFDAQAFATKLKQAENAYLADDFQTALQTYQELEKTLGAALDAGEIPPEQQERAQDALATITYQIGRSQQQLADCAAARQTFDRLEAKSVDDPELQSKLAIRAVEVDLCFARQAAEEGSYSDAVVAVQSAESGLANPELPGEERPDTEADLTTTRQQIFEKIETEANTTAAAGDCEAGQQQLKAGEALVEPESYQQSSASLDSQCASAVEPILAWTTVGVGGALILTAVIMEIASAGDVDDWETARDSCLDGNADACPEAVDLADSIETQRIATISLVTVGTLAVAGGLVWYFVFIDDDPAPAEGVGVYPSFDSNSASLNLGITW